MGYRILIVDDEPEILSALQAHCALLGYESDATDEPREALERVRLGHFHIVICDINMPGMNGVELLRRLRAERPTVQVIMITAYTSIDKAIDCWEGGASDYIMKPFDDFSEISRILDLTCRRIARWTRIARQSIGA